MTTTGTRHLPTAPGLVALAALALTACASDDDPAEFEDTEQAGQTEEAQEQEPDQADEAEDEHETADSEPENDEDADSAENDEDDSSDSGAETAEGPVGPEDALQTVEYEIPEGDIDGNITLGLQHLKIRGETLELFLTFTPEFDSDDTYNLWQLHGRQHAQTAARLIDRENLLGYTPLQSDDGDPLQTDAAGPEASSGDTLLFWATFPVPEDDIDTIDAGIPAAPEFEDVEIDWGEDEPADDEDEVDDQPGDAAGTDDDEEGESA